MTNPSADQAESDSHASSEPTGHPDQTGGNDSPQPEGFTLWAVFRRDRTVIAPAAGEESAVAELDRWVASSADRGVTVRGFYDVSGLRADADLMVWLHGPVAEDLQAALRLLRRTAIAEPLLPTWNAMGVHRAAEFNAAHIPAFLSGKEPRRWLTVYPFVRSHEWYLIDDAERGRMLSEHGRKGASFRSVLANTVASFALGDYEWILPMEADELVDLVDMMRALRYTDARRHVREETPFFTGRRITTSEILDVVH